MAWFELKKKKEIKKWYKSIKVNLSVVVTLVGLVPIIFLLLAILSVYNSNAKEQKLKEVKNYANIAKDILVTSGLENTDNMRTVAQIYDGRVVVVDEKLKIRYDANVSDIEDGKYCVSKEVIVCIKESKEFVNEKDDTYTEYITPIKVAGGDEIRGALIMIYSNENINIISELLKQKSIVIFVIVIIFVLLTAWYYSKIISESFMKVAKLIGEVREGYLDKIDIVTDFTETMELSEAFNDMLGRIEQLESSRQEFVSNVSHELKTPITSVKVLADSLIAQEDVPAELYREFMVDISDELERENKIINDLLALVKLDKKATDLNITNISINELLEMLLKRLRPLAAKRNIEIVFESFRPVNAEVDEVKLSLALNNLIENAIKYNYEDGWIRVSLNADHKFIYVKVADSGVGIPEDCQASIFERFYRVDKARSRDTGGSGLGLSITRNVIILHKGAIRVYSKEKAGTTFTIRIPLNYIP